MKELIDLLSNIKSDIDFSKEEKLIDDEIIGSLEILTIVMRIEKEYGIKIPISKIKPQNFNSAAAMWRMICELKEE